jgi:hypothetical protein
MSWMSGAKREGPAGERAVSLGALGPKAIEVPLVKANTSGTSQTSGLVIARIRNPSRKLGLAFQIHFEVHQADGRTIDSFAGAPANLWTTRVYDPDGGFLLHVLQTDATLPRQYEMETFAPGVEIRATLGLPLDVAAAAVAGTWKLIARWEPVIPMCDDEVRALYSQCAATLEKGLAIPLAP